MEKGVCIISIDYEHAWGVSDKRNTPENLTRIRNEASITERLITLFEKYSIPATWAVVAKLLEERVDTDSAWSDTNGFIKRIQKSSAGHEIGSHSYAHILYDTVDDSGATVDIGSAKLLHEKHGLPFNSFIFPRNREAHHAILKNHGITSFRGRSRLWYYFLPYRLWALGRGIDYWLPTAKTVMPERHPSGLINIPDSLLLVSRKGIQKILLPAQAVRKFVWGIRAAAKQKKIFHLWFHPSNFSYDTDTQFDIFENMLKHLARARDEGAIEVMTMGACAERYAQTNHGE